MIQLNACYDQTKYKQSKDRLKHNLQVYPSLFSQRRIFEQGYAKFKIGQNKKQWKNNFEKICQYAFNENTNYIQVLNTYLINIPDKLSPFFSEKKMGRLLTESQSTQKNIDINICSKIVKKLEQFNLRKVQIVDAMEQIQNQYQNIIWSAIHNGKNGQFHVGNTSHTQTRDKDLCKYTKMILRILQQFYRLTSGNRKNVLNFIKRQMNFLIDDFKGKIIRYKQQLQNSWEQFYSFMSPEQMFKKYKQHQMKNSVKVQNLMDAEQKIKKDVTQILLQMPHSTKYEISETINRIIQKINEAKDYSEYLPHLQKITIKRASHMTDEQNQRLFKAVFGTNYKRNFQMRFNHPIKQIYLANDQKFNCKSIHHFMINPKFAAQKQKPELDFNPTLDYANDAREFFQRLEFFADLDFPTRAIPLIQCQDYVRQFKMKTIIMPLQAFNPTEGKQQKRKRRQSRLSTIVQKCPQVQHLYIGQLTGLIDILPQQSKLHTNIKGDQQKVQNIGEISFLQYNFNAIKNIKTLVLYSVKATEKSFSQLKEFNNLSTFALINCIQIYTLDFQKLFSRRASLKNLIIDNTIGYNEIKYKSILKLKSLQTLILRHCTKYQQGEGDTTSTFSNLTNLTYLTVQVTNFIDENAVKQICSLEKLKHLNIRNGTYEGPLFISYLEDHLPNLETLVLGNKEQNQYDIEHFHRALIGKTKLRKLGLPEINYTEKKQDKQRENRRYEAESRAKNVLENIEYLKLEIEEDFFLNKILSNNLQNLKYVSIQPKNPNVYRNIDERRAKEHLRQYFQKSYLGVNAKISLFIDKIDQI